jgi:hypothetical protein
MAAHSSESDSDSGSANAAERVTGGSGQAAAKRRRVDSVGAAAATAMTASEVVVAGGGDGGGFTCPEYYTDADSDADLESTHWGDGVGVEVGAATACGSQEAGQRPA